MEAIQDPYSSLILLSIVLILPLLVVSTTSFIKISVVLFIVRGALGVQQAPPNMALYAIAVVLSVFVMAPVGNDILNEASLLDTKGSFESLEMFMADGQSLFDPLTAFMRINTDQHIIETFTTRAENFWPKEFLRNISTDNNLLILIPAFLVSELAVAFKIGILLSLPFIVVDLVVANVLTALGMMMVSPMMISLPFKLLLFITVNGWLRLTDGLILSYSYAVP